MQRLISLSNQITIDFEILPNQIAFVFIQQNKMKEIKCNAFAVQKNSDKKNMAVKLFVLANSLNKR